MRPLSKATTSSSWTILLGNVFEHYDTALYGFLAPMLAPLMFPHKTPIIALILAYLIIPIGMMAKVAGALFFGISSDQKGGGRILYWTLLGMAIVSAIIGLFPLGFLTPLVFTLGKMIQGFFAAGEVAAGATVLLEEAPDQKHDRLSSFYGVSTILGILIASLGVFLVCDKEGGWRILYLIGAGTVFFGLPQRKKRRRPSAIEGNNEPFSIRGLAQNLKPLALITLVSGFSAATYTVALVLINGLLPLATSALYQDMIQINTFLLIVDAGLLLLFGHFSFKVGREKIMLGAALTGAVLGVPLFLLLQEASLPLMVMIRVVLIGVGVAFSAPMYAWILRIAPQKNRYTTIFLGYALGGQFLGGPTAPLSLWLYHQTGFLAGAALYWSFLAAITFVVLLRSRAYLTQSVAKTNF